MKINWMNLAYFLAVVLILNVVYVEVQAGALIMFLVSFIVGVSWGSLTGLYIID